MAIFRMNRGLEASLPTTFTDGAVYFCKDTGNFFIDFVNAEGNLTRSKISAEYAEKLRYVNNGKSVELDPNTIITSDNYLTQIGTASTTQAGLMSAEDKKKLDGIAENASKVEVDSELSDASENPVQNKVIKAALDEKAGLAVATSTSDGLMSAADKQRFEEIASASGEQNQNAFSYIVVGDTQIAANAKTDTVSVVAGDNVELTADAENKTYTITAKDTTYSAASPTAAGLMSADDKSKLDGIAAGANKTTVDATISDTSTNPVQNKVVKSYVDAEVANIVGSAPETLNALNELAAALDNDPNFATSMATELGKKVDKVDGKGLSSNDFTDDDKEKLDNISVVTTSKDGLMSASDKGKLDGIAAGATKVVVDSVLTATSENPVQSKAIYDTMSWAEF